MSLLLPPLDGRIEVKGLLGEGGMGQVFRAWDHSLQRAVAVKFVRGSDPREAERLLLEARLQARVEHPHVVRVHEVGTLEGRPCIILQLVEGGTLADLPAETPQAVRVELLRQVAQGLHAAHLQGLIHRDMKPGNAHGSLQNAANALYMAADQLTDMDGEVDRLTTRALELAEQGLAKAPDHEALLHIKGEVLMVQAFWACLQDREPGPPMAEARRMLNIAVTRSKGMAVYNEIFAVLSLVEARWALHQGRSPEAALSDVERRLQPLLKAQKAQPGVFQNLALAALVRGQWAQRNKRPFQEKVKVGQAAITQAIQQDPGDPGLRVVEARLHALAGDKASGTKSLEAARELNAAVTGGPEYRRALRELGPGLSRWPEVA